MTIAQEIQRLPEEEIVFPPSDFYSDVTLPQAVPHLETDIHLQQIIILLESLNWLWQERNDFYGAGNLTIYYSPHQRKSSDFRGQEFFVVLDTEIKLSTTGYAKAEKLGSLGRKRSISPCHHRNSLNQYRHYR